MAPAGSSTRAIVQRGDNLVEEETVLPPLGPHELLIRVSYAALNPTDMLAFRLNAFGDGAVLGCDCSGVVEQTGDDVAHFALGDKVASFIWGGERPGVGAFSEHCIIDSRIAFKVPDSITLEEATTIPLAANTAYLALYSSDCLALDQHAPLKAPLLILGGSTSVGSFATQFAADKGLDTIVTARPANVPTTTKDGALAAFDYSQPTAADEINKKYPGINLIFDTVGYPESAKLAQTVLGDRDGMVCTVRPGKTGTENFPANIAVSDVFVFTAFPKSHSYRGTFHWPMHPENYTISKELHLKLPRLISEGKIRPRPVLSLGKLTAEAVLKGINMIKAGSVSNSKICFTVAGE